MQTRPLNTAYRLALRCAQADVIFYVLPFIMLNLFIGTLAQANMGLYEAHHTYFSAFYYFLGPVPLPGGYTLLGLLSGGLALKFVLQSRWSQERAGIILTHLGALVLLIGGLFTAVTAREGYMLIPEGAASPYVYDYQRRELFVFENNNLLKTFAFGDEILGLPFDISLKDSCVNCNIIKREDSAQDFGNAPLHSMAQFMALKSTAEEKESEENISGMSFEISGADDQNGIYIAFEGMPKPIELTKNERNYKIIFGKQQRLLPFSIELTDFYKESYPGTDMAKDYTSEVLVHDNGAVWAATIEMNEPLRYKGYTFYQSSFVEQPGAQATVLSVVENKGRLFPYIGAAIIALGLLMHVFIIAKGRGTL